MCIPVSVDFDLRSYLLCSFGRHPVMGVASGCLISALVDMHALSGLEGMLTKLLWNFDGKFLTWTRKQLGLCSYWRRTSGRRLDGCISRIHNCTARCNQMPSIRYQWPLVPSKLQIILSLSPTFSRPERENVSQYKTTNTHIRTE